MVAPFAMAAASMLPQLAGGILGQGASKRAASRQWKQGLKLDQRQRYFQLRDRKSERKYAKKLTKDERRYAASLTRDDRKYARELTGADRKYAERQGQRERQRAAKITADDRRYAADITARDRRYAADITARDRRYAAGLTASDRAYAAKLSARDRANFLADKSGDARAYKTDRAGMQKVANKLAVANMQSRGLDFKGLRDDAIAAGFNPLTALQFAQSYSTEVNYGQVGDVFNPGASGAQSPASHMAGTQMAGSQFAPGMSASTTTAAPPAVIGSSAAPTTRGQSFQAPPSAFQSGGGGYSSQAVPAFLGSEFWADTLGSGVQSYFNTISENEERQTRSVEAQVVQSNLERYYGKRNPYQGFGYSTSQPYGSAMTGSDGGVLRGPTGVALPQGPGSDAQECEDRYGEFAGEVCGLGNAVQTGDQMVANGGFADLFTPTGGGLISVVPKSWLPAGWTSEMTTGVRPKAPVIRPARPVSVTPRNASFTAWD